MVPPPGAHLRLVDQLVACEDLEQRAAAVYRRFADADRADTEAAALWTALASEEDAHARAVSAARRRLAARTLPPAPGREAMKAVAQLARRLRQAEVLAPGAPLDRRLYAALDVELSELESFRRLEVAIGEPGAPPLPEAAHVQRLGDTALRRSRDRNVRVAAALLLARQRLAADGPA